MFADLPEEERRKKVQTIMQFLNAPTVTKTHGRQIGIETLQQLGVLVEPLEADDVFEDLVLSVHHATTLTLSGTRALKIIENHNGVAQIVNIPHR